MNEPSVQSSGLAQFLATIRITEGNDYQYRGQSSNGVRPFGAYGMLEENWASWSSAAGVGDVDRRDPAAQDAVAAYWAQRLFQRYGDWDMVGAAWFAGVKATDQAAATSDGIKYFKNPDTKKWLEQFTVAKNDPSVSTASVPGAGRQWINPGGAPRGWLNPVAGSSEYSNSFMVKRTNNKTGIHGAIDVYAKLGTPIVAPVGGKVISTKQGGLGGFTARILGDDGLTYYFAHMDQAAVVGSGDRIQAGSHLGFVGASGNAAGTSPHLHFSVKKGSKLVNPYTYLQGAKNAGNYYAPDAAAAHGTEQQQGVREKYTSLLDAISNRAAGGQRTDYRTLGMGSAGGTVEDPEAQGGVRESDLLDDGRTRSGR